MVINRSGSTMVQAKLFLVACLIALAVSTAVDPSDPIHPVTHHSTHHNKHKSTDVSSEHVNLENPPLEGVAHNPSHQKHEPVKTSTNMASETAPLEAGTHQSHQQVSTSSPASPVTVSHIPPKAHPTHPLAHQREDLTVTSRQTKSENHNLHTATHLSAQHSTKSTTGSPMTQLGVPQQDEETQPFTHSTTDATDNSKKTDLDIPSLATNDHHRSGQHKTITPNVAAKASLPPEHGKHHLTHHKQDPSVKPTHDNMHNKLPLESVNHQPKHLTIGGHIPELDNLHKKDTSHHVTTSSTTKSDITAHDPKALHPVSHSTQEEPEVSSNIESSEDTLKIHSANIKQETTTTAPTVESRLQANEAKTHHSAHMKEDAVKVSPKIELDIPSEKSMKNHHKVIKHEQTTSPPIFKSDVTTQEGHLQLPTGTPALKHVATEHTPLEVQLEMAETSPPSASQNIRPKPSMQIGNEKIQESKEVAVGPNPPQEVNGTQLNTSAPPKTDSKDSLPANTSDTNSSQNASEAESKLYPIKVKPPTSSQYRNPANDNRQRSKTQEDDDERGTMARVRKLNPSVKNTRIVQNRRGRPQLRQKVNEEHSVSDEMEPDRANGQQVKPIRNNHHGPRNTPPTSGLRGVAQVDSKMKARVRPTRRQNIAGETIPDQGNVRMTNLENKEKTGRNQMSPVPKRISGNANFKAGVHGGQFIAADDYVNVDTLVNRGDQRGDNKRGRAFVGQRQTADSKKPAGRISGKHVVTGAENPPTQGRMKTASLEESRNNRRGHTFTDASQTADPEVDEHTFVNGASKPTQVNNKMANVAEERGHKREQRTFTGQRRNSGTIQAKGRVIDKEFVAVDETTDLKNTKPQSSAGHGNRRNDQQMSARKPTSVDQRVKQRATGETGNVEMNPLIERRVIKRNNRTSVSRGQSSSNDQIKTRMAPLQFDTDAPGRRSVKMAEIENRHASRPSTGLRYTPGDNQGRSRRVDRKTQPNLRRGGSSFEGGERVGHIRKKRRVACTGMDCTETRPDGKEVNDRYLSSKEYLKMKCAKCFKVKGCSTRDVMACNAAGMNFVIEEDKKLERVFNIVNLYGGLTLCVLFGLLIYVYMYQRSSKESNAFLCTGLIVLSIFYIIAILAFVNAQKLLE